MERPIINFQDTRLQSGMAASCRLRLVLGTDGFAYTVWQNDLLLLKSWAYTPEQCEMALRRILHSEVPLALRYGSVEVLFASPWVTLVPQRMYQQEPAPNSKWFALLMERPPEQILEANWQGGNAVVLQGVPNLFVTLLRSIKLFQDAQPADIGIQAKHLLTHWQGLNPVQNKWMCLHLRNSYLQVAAYDAGHLQFFNSFEFSTANDVLYYALLAYQSAGLDPLSCPLMVSGQATADSEIHKVLLRFVRNIQFDAPRQIPASIQGMPSHLFLELFT